MKENKWERLAVSMPDAMQSFGCIMAGDGRSVVVFGGSDSEGISDKIHVLDLMTMKWRQSKVLSLSRRVCPAFNHGEYALFVLQRSAVRLKGSGSTMSSWQSRMEWNMFIFCSQCTDISQPLWRIFWRRETSIHCLRCGLLSEKETRR